MKKLFFFFLFLTFAFLLLTLFPSSALAGYYGGPQTQPGGPPGVAPGGYGPIESLKQEVFNTNEINKGSYDFDTVVRTIPSSLAIGILGTTIISPTGQQVYYPGAVSFLAGAIGTLYDVPPASGKEYFADMGRNLGFIKPAQAQGFGFEKLSPVLPIWQAMRNVVYLFFVLVFVVVGFMIMFRMHIDPRTVVSIQLALPQIITALLLVTFSYAIAGLLVDLTELSLNLVVKIFEPVPGFKAIETNQTVFNLMLFWVTEPGKSIGVVADLINEVIGKMVQGDLLKGLAQFTSWIGGGIVGLIFSVAILIAMFRLFFSLLIAYLTIILLIIFAPFMFLMAAIPGRGSIWSWFKNMLMNILVFPAVAGFFTIAHILTTQPQITGGGWQAPFLGITSDTIRGLMGLGMILIAPKIPDLIKEAFQTRVSPTIGEALKPGGVFKFVTRVIPGGRLIGG